MTHMTHMTFMTSMTSVTFFTENNFLSICNKLAAVDSDLSGIMQEYGPPPMWVRPNNFSTLVLTILEQQVSLASAYAAYSKLKEKLGDITPEGLLEQSDETLRACYLSRQKIVYTRELASAIYTRKISLEEFEHLDEENIRTRLKALKGIGDWTVDIYLIHALRRADLLPLGDLALVNAMKMVKNLGTSTKEQLFDIAESWRPYRSVATMMLWHFYIKKKNIKLLH
jgi:DNA-3-methyladenine glycosylase II